MFQEITSQDESQYSFSAPIANNPDFEYTCTDVGFRDWKAAGITKIHDLYLGDALKSFQQLQKEFNLPQMHFYHYLQIRSYLNSTPYYKNGRKLNILDNLIMKAATLNKKVMTYIYDQLLMNDKTTMNIKNSFEKDLGAHLDDQTWCKVLYNAKKITRSDKSHETQYKIINKLHVTPEICSKYDNSCSACRKCEKQPGTYFHLMWSCPLIKIFWSSVQREIDHFLGIRTVMDPKLCILGVSSLSGQKAKLLSIMLYATRLSILHTWLDVNPPTLPMWHEKLLSIFPYERLSNVLQGTLDDFIKEWFPLSTYFGCEWPAITCIGVD